MGKPRGGGSWGTSVLSPSGDAVGAESSYSEDQAGASWEERLRACGPGERARFFRVEANQDLG